MSAEKQNKLQIYMLASEILAIVTQVTRPYAKLGEWERGLLEKYVKPYAQKIADATSESEDDKQ